MNRATLFFTLAFLSFSLIGCQAKQATIGSSGTNSDISQSIADCTARISLHMMQSPAFTEAESAPSIVIGKITNTTGNDALPIHVAENAMIKVVRESAKANILPYGTGEFDYTTHVAIHDTTARNGTKKQYPDYTIRVQLLNYYGEVVGQWSAKTSSF